MKYCDSNHITLHVLLNVFDILPYSAHFYQLNPTPASTLICTIQPGPTDTMMYGTPIRFKARCIPMLNHQHKKTQRTPIVLFSVFYCIRFILAML